MTLLMIIKSDIEIVTYSLKLRYFFNQLSLGLYQLVLPNSESFFFTSYVTETNVTVFFYGTPVLLSHSSLHFIFLKS